MSKRFLHIALISCLVSLWQPSIAQQNTDEDDVLENLEDLLEDLNQEEQIDVDQYEEVTPIEIDDATDTITVSEIPEENIEKYRNQNAFRYKNAKRGNSAQSENWLNRLFMSFLRLLGDIFGFSVSRSAAIVMKWIFLSSIGLLVLYYILRWAGVDLRFRKRKKQEEKAKIVFEEIEENIHEVDFDQLIKSAIKDKNYKIAIRLYFLKNLRHLSERSAINWQPNKTNTEYKYELDGTEYKAGFDQTVYLFEHIWYGNFSLNETDFQNALNKFRNFENLVSYEE